MLAESSSRVRGRPATAPNPFLPWLTSLPGEPEPAPEPACMFFRHKPHCQALVLSRALSSSPSPPCERVLPLPCFLEEETGTAGWEMWGQSAVPGWLGPDAELLMSLVRLPVPRTWAPCTREGSGRGRGRGRDRWVGVGPEETGTRKEEATETSGGARAETPGWRKGTETYAWALGGSWMHARSGVLPGTKATGHGSPNLKLGSKVPRDPGLLT